MYFIDICDNLINFEKIAYIKFEPDRILITFAGGENFDIGLDTIKEKEFKGFSLIVSKEQLEAIKKNLRDKALGNI